MTSRGKAFEAELYRSFSYMYPSGFVARFTDAVFGKGNMSRKTPPDLIVNYGGSTTGFNALVEAKAVKGTSIPLNRLQDHQLAALKKYDNIGAGYHGFIAVNFYNGKLGKERVNEAYLVPVSEWDGEQLGRKSLSLAHCKRHLGRLQLRWLASERVWVWM